jgi:hypothetical protein
MRSSPLQISPASATAYPCTRRPCAAVAASREIIVRASASIIIVLAGWNDV